MIFNGIEINSINYINYRHICEGFSLSTTDKNGDNIYSRVAYEGELYVVKYCDNNRDRFLDLNFDIVDQCGNNVLCSSAMGGHIEIFDRVYDTGKFDLKSKNTKGNDALFIAVSIGSVNIMKYLFQKYDWKVENINELYLTTVRNKEPDVLKYLDETQEINVFYINGSNKTALDYAMEADDKDEDIIGYIKLMMKKAGDEIIELKKKLANLKKMNF